MDVCDEQYLKELARKGVISRLIEIRHKNGYAGAYHEKWYKEYMTPNLVGTADPLDRQSELDAYYDRFVARYTEDDHPNEKCGTPCWLWDIKYCVICGGSTRKWLNGADLAKEYCYASFHYPDEYGNPRTGLGHRYSWEVHHGPIPKGMDVEHDCGVSRCVNPNHLKVVTKSQHNIIGAKKRKARLMHERYGLQINIMG